MNDWSTTVLVVDDEEDVRLLVRVVLEAAGLQVIEDAVDGPSALRTVERLDPPPVPTVIVLDNRMPGLSGLEVAQRLREHVPDQRIVLFSAFLNDEIEATARELGISACVAKADVAELPAVIAGLVDES